MSAVRFRPWAPSSRAPHLRGFLVMGFRDWMRTIDSGSTKCDHKSILDARAQRRRPVGVRAAKAMLLESFRPWAPSHSTKTFYLSHFYSVLWSILDDRVDNLYADYANEASRARTEKWRERKQRLSDSHPISAKPCKYWLVIRTLCNASAV